MDPGAGDWPPDFLPDEHGWTVSTCVSELLGSTTRLAPAGIWAVPSAWVPQGGTTTARSLRWRETTSERMPGVDLGELDCELELLLPPELELELLLDPHEASAPARTSMARIATT